MRLKGIEVAAMRKKTPATPAEQPVSNAKILKKRRLAVLNRQGYVSLLVKIVVIVLVVYVLLTQVFLVTQASGNEMYPMVKDGDLIIAYRLQEDYEKDDIVVYTVGDQTRIGRIAAMAGDVVNMDDSGTLTVNGTVQTGDILFPTYDTGSGMEYPYVVPDGCVFIMGDYRTISEDSRDLGAIDMDNVEGKVISLLRRREL